jgi:hypothetical protein
MLWYCFHCLHRSNTVPAYDLFVHQSMDMNGGELGGYDTYNCANWVSLCGSGLFLGIIDN